MTAEPTDTALASAPEQSADDGTTRKIGYQPGLDGLRGVALLSIFVVHANVGWAPGGFLAVSTFFTLSGFLITALLVSERSRKGRVDLVAFWKRRARRLLPASLIAILVIALAALWLGDPTQIDNLPGDVVGVLVYAANWRFLIADTTYAGEFAGQSPLLHFWSLAIEEQFYLVFPIIMGLVFARFRRWQLAGAVMLGFGILASLVAGIVSSQGEASADRLYFRTDIRAGELLIGALAGMWWATRGQHTSERFHQAVRALGGVLLVFMVWLIATSDYGDTFWYQGGLIAYSLVTVGVILAAVESRGLAQSVLAWRPLVGAGVVSYGAYLVHWPMFMWLYTETSISGPVRLIGGSAVALTVAYASHRFIERPVREQRSILPVPALAGIGTTLALGALVVGFAAPKFVEPENTPLDEANDKFEQELAPTAAAPGEAPTVGLFGDSTALVRGLALATFDNEDPTIRLGPGFTGLGCTITVPAQFVQNGAVVDSYPGCDDYIDKWALAAQEEDLDVALLEFGPWEVKDIKPEGADSFAVIGEPERDAMLEKRMVTAVETLREAAPIVVIMTSPYIEPGRINGRPPPEQQPDADPARMDRLNEMIIDIASRYDDVAVLDWANWLERSGEDNRLRPDGIHLSESAALETSPRLTASIASIVEVANGAEPPPDGGDGFPVLQYADT